MADVAVIVKRWIDERSIDVGALQPELAHIPDVGGWFAWRPASVIASRCADFAHANQVIDRWVKTWLGIRRYVSSHESYLSPVATSAIVVLWQRWVLEAGTLATEIVTRWAATERTEAEAGDRSEPHPVENTPEAFSIAAQSLGTTVDMLHRAANGLAEVGPKSLWIANACVATACDAILHAPVFAFSRAVTGIANGSSTLKPVGAREAQLFLTEFCMGRPTAFEGAGGGDGDGGLGPAPSFMQVTLGSDDALAKLALIAAGSSGGSGSSVGSVEAEGIDLTAVSAFSTAVSLEAESNRLPLGLCLLATWMAEPFRESLRREMFAFSVIE